MRFYFLKVVDCVDNGDKKTLLKLKAGLKILFFN